MSEKKSGKTRGYRPDTSEPPLPPDEDVVQKLLKDAEDKGKTKVSEDVLSPTASELKAAMKNVTVGTTTNLSSSKPLNPSAPAFTPSSSVPLNPNSAEFTPRGVTLPTKHLPSQSSQLNPNSVEFVPSSKSPLNVNASDFVPTVAVPTSLQNGNIGIDELVDQEELKNLIPQEEEVPVFEPQDIVGRFERVAEVGAEDQEGYDHLLTTTAEMLLKATMYPGSFDRLKLNIVTSVEKYPPVDATLQNLAEMIIHWGISEPSLRYVACRISHEVCTILGDKAMEFKKPFFIRLQTWYMRWKQQFEAEPLTESSKYYFINLSLFYAEVFVRVRVRENPFPKLVQVMFEFVRKLLELKEDGTIIAACHILKLTGAYLESSESASEMKKIVEQLTSLDKDTSLTSKTTDLVARVIQLQAKNWDRIGASTPVPSSQQTSTTGPVTSKLNTDAPVFVPSGEIEFHYQQPVRNAEEWKEYFEGDDDIDLVDQPDFGIEVDDEGLDPEIELEMEAFIDEIEEHLMMRDFDPDLDYSGHQ